MKQNRRAYFSPFKWKNAKGPQFLINVPEFILILCTTKECIIFPRCFFFISSLLLLLFSCTLATKLFLFCSGFFCCCRCSWWCNELNQFFLYSDFSSGSFALFFFFLFLSFVEQIMEIFSVPNWTVIQMFALIKRVFFRSRSNWSESKWNHIFDNRQTKANVYN